MSKKTDLEKTMTHARSDSKTRSRSVATRRVVRKAPTKAAGVKISSASPMKLMLSVLAAAVVVGGASIAIGMSDKGQIDVASTISQRASVQESEGDTAGSAATRAVSANQNAQTVPNGGLVGKGNKVTEQQTREQQSNTSETASTTATSTDETASSTEETSGAGEEQSGEENVDSEATIE